MGLEATIGSCVKSLVLGLAVSFSGLLYSPNTCGASEAKNEKVTAETIDYSKKIPGSQLGDSDKICESDAEFIRSLDIDKLENFAARLKYVPFNQFKKLKVSNKKKESPELEQIIRMINTLYKDDLNHRVSDRNHFLYHINSTSEKLNYKNSDSMGAYEKIARDSNLVRYWITYNWFMILEDSGMGLDVNKDGRHDGIATSALISLDSELRSSVMQYPDMFRELSIKDRIKVDSTPLDAQLDISKGEEGKLFVVCRNNATLLDLVFNCTKSTNPNLLNISTVRDKNSSHMWNLFFANTDNGVYATPIDLTKADNGKKKFEKIYDLDYHRTYDGWLMKKGFLHWVAALTYSTLDHHDESVILLEDILQKNRKFELRPLLLRTLAYSYRFSGDADKALKTYEKLKGTEYEDVALYNSGVIHSKRREFDKAYACYDNLVNRFKSSQYMDEAFVNVADDYYERGDYDEAIKQCEFNLKVLPRHIDSCLFIMAESYYAKKDNVSAKKFFERLMRDYPGNDYSDKVKKRLDDLNK